jgi:outer membrane receptor for ferrienterochelin and colicins
MRLFVLSTALLAPAVILAEGFGRIEGTVTDKESGNPLAGVNVIIKHTSLGAAADGDGNYSMAVPAGEYEVVATMMGFRAVTREARIAENETSVLDFKLEESMIELGGIVVTGTRTPRYIKDTPVRTEVITSRRLKERGAPNLYEALEGTPGIRVEQQCSYCNFSVIRMQGLESGHCQILIDGMPTYSGLASVYGAQQVAAGGIDRIEIVKGAGSALYGSSALSGIINVVTKKPGAEPSIKASTSIGTANTNEYVLSAARRYGNTDMVINAQKNTGDGIDQDNDGFTDRVRTDNLSIGARVSTRNVFGDDQLTLSGRTLNEMRTGGDMGDADSDDQWLPRCWQNPFSAGTESIKTSRYEAGIGYKRSFRYGNETGLQLNSGTHNRNATNDGFLGDYMDTHGDSIPPVNEMAPYFADENLHVVDWNYSQPFGRAHRALTGVQYSYNNLEESGRYVIVDEDSPDYGGTYTSESEKYAHDIGIYLQDEMSMVSGLLQLVTGARYDIHRSKDDFGGSGKVAPEERIALEYSEEAFSPRLALMFRTTPELALRSSIGTGFRVPYGFSEDLHLCSGSPRVNKPAGLKPEKSLSFNLGADYSARKFTVNANLFRTQLENKIGFVDASESSAVMGYTYEWANIDNAYTQGVEFGFRTALGSALSLDLSSTYTDAQYEHEREDWVEAHAGKYAASSKHIPRVPCITGNIGLGYMSRDWRLSFNSDYTGRMYIDYCEEDDVEAENSYIKHTDPFWVLNTRVSRSLSGNGLSLFLGAKNILDYVQPEKHPDDAAFMYAPYTGRIIYGGVEMKL